MKRWVAKQKAVYDFTVNCDRIKYVLCRIKIIRKMMRLYGYPVLFFVEDRAMDVEENINLFQEQIMCGCAVYTWQYKGDMQLIHTNCPESKLFDEALTLFDCKKALIEHAGTDTRPLLLSSPIGMIWAAAMEKREDVLQRIVVLGPVFSTDHDMHSMDRALRQFATDKDISHAWISHLVDVLSGVPVLQINILQQYALMLHFCITGEQLHFGDIQYQNLQDTTEKGIPVKDCRRVWMVEQALISSVRRGDLNYHAAVDNAAVVSTGITMHNTDSVRRAKNSVIVFIALCTRAAIEGGLSPEQAYNLEETYIQDVEGSSTVSEVASYSYTMHADFVERVHKCRGNPNISPQIRAACEYIEMHTDKPFSLSELAGHLGYVEYYLTRKFKSEMGVSITDYLKASRVDRAKLLLATTDLSVQEIADQLQFCTRSYFGRVFSQEVGCTPMEYRAQQKRI